MFSFGIRFGQGFDKTVLTKVMQSVPVGFDYDLLVIGSSPGGVACAREARVAGKRVAIVKYRTLTPAEEAGVDENLEEMARVLDLKEGSGPAASPSKKKIKSILSKSMSTISRTSSKTGPRKVRHSRLDMNNEFFRRGQQGRKLMHNAATVRDLIEDAQNCGWRLVSVTNPLTINWSKMMDQVMDYVMRENWNLMTELNRESVEVIEGFPEFLDSHTVKITHQDTDDLEVSATTICIAISADFFLPVDVEGAAVHGLTCDDFIRMEKPPGKTLVVGAVPEGLECAGIVAGCRFPVTVVSRSRILKGHDTEISQMIVADLSDRGVVFLENTTLESIYKAGGRLVARFVTDAGEDDNPGVPTEDLFDSVIFAVGKNTLLTTLGLEKAGVEYDLESQKIKTDELDTTSVPNIYAVGDAVEYRPEGYEVSEMAGRLLGKRLFQDGSQIMDYTLLPSVMFTPTEYAFVGISEDTALYRFGVECIDVYRGYFRPLDFVLPPRKGQCFGKVIVLKSTDLVIGVHMFGPDAGEAIQGFAVAIKTGMTMSKLQTVVPVPATRAQTILKFKNQRSQEPEPELEPEP